ncbi:ThiF family adenylyltransferase [uncultured Cohaesibacter sp.]|uniref:ThiF family adenylyltransferase n=1 Tax=uncultured Cohaesibacter sp. TaxID=1002546 RepID=UPI00292FFBC7|nr:ThiF family adenylyltransferase [uncultured Cohaesibacter sp.]
MSNILVDNCAMDQQPPDVLQALGSPLLLYLAAIGVGHLGIIYDDLVSLSNLQSQILHATQDLNRSLAV